LARAIIEACKADAKYLNKLPAISGQDAEFDSLMMIKNGEQTSTVFKALATQAEAAMILVDQILKAQPINIPGAVLAGGATSGIADTGKGYVTTYLLDPVVVTKANLAATLDAIVAANVITAAQAAQLR